MAPLANSLSLRLIGFLLGSVVLLCLAVAFAFEPVSRQRYSGDRLPLPGQAAAIVEVLEAAAPERRPQLLAAMNSSSLSVRLVDALPMAAGRAGSAPILTRFLDRYDDAFANRDVHVDLQRRRNGGLLGEENWRPVKLYVHLEDGPWVLIEPVRAALVRGVVGRSFLIVAIAGIALIVLLVVAARQTARPIEKLAASARTFATRLDAPDLEAKGPRELRDLAVAFNDMKSRIRGLVNDRTRLVAAIAHDLRTYMTRLRMRAEFITDPAQRERAERDIEEMNALIDDTMLFARSSERGLTSASVSDVAAELLAFAAARREVGENVALAPPPAASAAIDPVALRRILANLTDNAIRYGGSAEVSASLAGETVMIEVADRGPGVPEGEIDRIIAPFERIEPSRGRAGGGSGLGLAIVKALAEGHGGSFTLANRPGGGVSAKLSLPAAKSK
jgi:two-component system, OmpR family, osmolarity sensor histidine kinase EnvZ